MSGVLGLGPWLAVAGLGALHGLNPAAGWALVAALGVPGGERAAACRARAPAASLASLAIGHAASVALVALLAVVGVVAQRGVLPWIAGGSSLLVAAIHVSGHLPGRLRHATGQAGLALWSFAMATVQGAGMMLVPAVFPLCVSGSPAREIAATGSLALALAAVVLHLAAMLAVTAAMAALARRVHGLLLRCRAPRAA